MTIILSLLFSFYTMANTIPDLPPDAMSTEYREILESLHLTQSFDELDPVVAAGERNLDWLNYINSFRKGDKLSFTSKETQRGIPIDHPNEYNAEIVLNNFTQLREVLPETMRKVLLEGAPFTKEVPIAEKDYLASGLLLDRVYQSASRWRMMKAYLPSLKVRRKNDIRGYYFLSKMSDRIEKFRDIKSLPMEEKNQLMNWLVGMCLNASRDITVCKENVNQLIASGGDLEAYYQTLLSNSKSIYDGFFIIPRFAVRRDFRWVNNGEASNLITPFLDPIRTEVRDFVQKNIEEEWQWNTWKLTVPLVEDKGQDNPYIVFVPGATPHVNGLGGSEITMNANQPLTEYGANWTIRHEFGHVLGFPDCYVEFYEAERSVIVNYQLDIENIMCSRRGHVKLESVSELIRVYQK